MSQFFPGDMVEIMERGKVRAVGQIRARACWSRDNEPYYLVLPVGEKSLAQAIAAYHGQLQPSIQYKVANENKRAAGSFL